GQVQGSPVHALRRLKARTTLLVAAILVVAIPPSTALATTKSAATVKHAAAKPAQKKAAKPAATQVSSSSTPVFVDGVVAVVDGEPITLRELKQYGINSAPFLPPQTRGDYKALLDSMIEHRLLKSEFEKNGIVAEDAMVDRY